MKLYPYQKQMLEFLEKHKGNKVVWCMARPQGKSYMKQLFLKAVLTDKLNKILKG